MTTNTKIPRPKKVSGNTEEITTGCGHLYVTVNSWDGKPYEVFATLGKSGDCEKCQIEAITRCISTSLQYGVPLKAYVKQLRGIRCPKLAFGGGKDGQVLSCPDGISKVLMGYLPEEDKAELNGGH